MVRPWPLFIVFMFLSGCDQPSSTEGGQPQVVASFSILSDWVREVAGDQVELQTLVKAGGDAHVYDPTPQDVGRLGESNVLFELGLGFEGWLKDLVEASGFEGRRVAVTDGIEARESDHSHHDHEGDHHHHHGVDPHIWHDVKHVKLAVGHIRDTLVAVDEANAEIYKSNAESYLKELDELDSWMKEQFSKIPNERRYLVTSHDSLGYLAEGYDFTVVGSALGSMSTEAEDPSAGELAELIDKIRSLEVPAVFWENMHSSKVIETVARECNVKSYSLFTDSLAPTPEHGSTYLDMMRRNTETIVKALTP